MSLCIWVTNPEVIFLSFFTLSNSFLSCVTSFTLSASSCRRSCGLLVVRSLWNLLNWGLQKELWVLSNWKYHINLSMEKYFKYDEGRDWCWLGYICFQHSTALTSSWEILVLSNVCIDNYLSKKSKNPVQWQSIWF